MHLFQTLWQLLNASLTGQVVAISNAFSTWAMPMWRAGALLWFVMVCFQVASGQAVINGGLTPKFIRLIIFGFALSGTYYTTQLAPAILNGLPNAIMNAIGGAAGLPAGGAAALFDNLMVAAWDIVLKVKDSLGILDLLNPMTMFLILECAVFLTVAALAILGAFLFWASAQIALMVAVAFGPILLLCGAFPATKRFFEMGYAFCLSAIFTEAVTSLLLVIMINGIKPNMQAILNGNGGDMNTVVHDILLMVLAGALFVFIGMALMKVGHWATAIFGGAMHQAGRISAALMNTTSIATQSAISAAAPASGITGGIISAIPGRSLSRP